MSLSDLSTFEVRPSVGNDANGGGFVTGASGTDYSQQDSAQVSYTDLVIGATQTQLTSAAFPFTSDHVGNIVSINSGSGFTPGLYQVVSVASAVATMDRNVGTATSTGGVGRLGGAHASLGPCGSASLAQFYVWIKDTGSVVLTSTFSPASRYVRMQGYGSTRGDGSRATITTATNSVRLITLSQAGASWFLKNLNLTNTAGSKAAGIYNSGSVYFLYLDNVRITGCSQGYDGGAPFVLGTAGYHLSFLNCEIDSNANEGCRFYSGNVNMVGCYIHGNAGDGLRFNDQAGSITLDSTIVYDNGGYGLGVISGNDGNGSVHVNLKNTVFMDNASSGVRQYSNGTAYTQPLSMVNCIFLGNGGWGIEHSYNFMRFQVGRSNGFLNNTSGDRDDVDTFEGDFVLTGDPFVNASSGNFALNDVAGADCKGAGFPGVLLHGGTGYADIGPLASAGSTPSEGGAVIISM